MYTKGLSGNIACGVVWDTPRVPWQNESFPTWLSGRCLITVSRECQTFLGAGPRMGWKHKHLLDSRLMSLFLLLLLLLLQFLFHAHAGLDCVFLLRLHQLELLLCHEGTSPPASFVIRRALCTPRRYRF